MKIKGNFLEFLYKKFSAIYIEFVRFSSKIMIYGDQRFMDKFNEKFIFVFWHGDSYCFYLQARKNFCVLTTADREGEYISNLVRHFKGIPIRVPDKSSGRNLIYKIKKTVGNKYDLAMTLDGPLGPFHEPKVFPFVLARFLKRRIVPVAVSVKWKIRIASRWDRYMIPLPFNAIKFCVYPPVFVSSRDQDSEFMYIREKIKRKLKSSFI